MYLIARAGQTEPAPSEASKKKKNVLACLLLENTKFWIGAIYDT